MVSRAKTHRLMPESQFADAYKVIRTMGEGAMGTVYEVTRLRDARRCALKVLKPSIADGEKSAERFGREARVGETIDSPHVVEVFDAGFDEQTGLHWLSMEYLEGRNLGDHLTERSPDRAERMRLIEELFDAMTAAHRAGVIHRDLKPENVFVVDTPAGPLLKVLDFGVAKTMRAGMVASATEGGLGTPLWTAPEQGKGGEHIRPAVDVWALGLLTFFVLTGKMYWLHANQQGSSMLDLAKEMLRDAIEAPSQRASQIGADGSVPSGLDGWFERCVNREQSLRYVDAGEAWAALAPILAGAGSEALRPSEPPESVESVPSTLAASPAALARRSKLTLEPGAGSRRLAPIALAAIVALVTVALWLWLR